MGDSFEPDSFEPDPGQNMTPVRKPLTMQEIMALPDPRDQALARLQAARDLGSEPKEEEARRDLGFANQNRGRELRQAEVDQMPWVDRKLAGFGGGIMHAAQQVGNLVGQVSDQAVKEDSNDPLAQSVPWSHAAGNALPAVAASVAGAAASGGASLPLGLRALLGAGEGLAQGAVLSDPGSRLGGAGVSAAVGGMLPVGGAVVKRGVRGFAQPRGGGAFLDAASPEYAERMTTGQLAGGAFRDLEEGATHLPYFGNRVQAAQAEGKKVIMQEMELLANPTPSPGVTPPPLPRGNVQEWWRALYDRVNGAYDTLKNTPKQTAPINTPTLRQAIPWQGPLKDLPVQVDAAKLLSFVDDSLAKSGAAPGTDAYKQAAHVLQNATQSLAQGTGATWGGLHDLRVVLRAAGSKAKDDGVKSAIKNLEAKITGELVSPLSHGEAQALKDADKAYANVLMAREALIDQAGLQGKYTNSLESRPLRRALEGRMGDNKVAGGGGGWLRDFIEAADDAFGPKHINAANAPGHLTSSSAGRSVGSYLSEAAAALPVALGAYSKPGQALLKGQTVGQRALSKALATPAGAAADAAGAAVVQPTMRERANKAGGPVLDPMLSAFLHALKGGSK